jgi:ATP-binding cassette, subfamily B, bacterial
VFSRLRARHEWTFFAVLPSADRPLAIAWWTLVLLRGMLPAVFALTMGVLVSAVQRGGRLAPALTLIAIVFLLLQVLAPLHQAVGANLGDRTSAWLYDRLTAHACVRRAWAISRIPRWPPTSRSRAISTSA